MTSRLHNLFPILLFTTTLILTGCFEKKKEEVTTSPSTGGGGSTTPPPSNNYGYVTLSYPASVSGTYRTGNAFSEINPTSNIVSATLTNFTVSPSLPVGLSMDPDTGAISGTVYSLWKEQNYTISAQKPDSEGAVTAVINFGFNSSMGVPVDNSIDHSDLRYPQKYITLIVGQAMASATPTYEGPQDVTFFGCGDCGNTPGLGELGLTFDNATGTYSGTPTNPITNRVFTTTNNAGMEGQLIITIIEGAPTNLTYSNNSASYPVGYAITTNTPAASGGNVASYSVSPTLPTGLSLDTTTGEITGTPTVIQSSANYTITATNVAGSGTKQISITVTNAAPANLSYVTVSSRYTVGASITANNPIITGGGTPTSYSVNPALPNGLTLNTSTGVISGTPTVMTAAASYTVTATNSVGSANKVIGINVVNPGSHVLYVGNGSVLKAYSVDEVTGEPIFVDKKISSGIYSKLQFHPTLDCAFGYSGGAVSSFSINKSDNGQLTAVNSLGGLSTPLNMVMSADGKFLFVVNNQDPSTQFIMKYEVNSSDCSLSAAASTSVQYSTTFYVRDIAIAGSNVYVNYSSGKIRHLKFDNNGALSTYADYNGGGTLFLTGTASGTHLYLTGEQSSVKTYSVDNNGDLTVDSSGTPDSGVIYSTTVPPVMDTVSARLITSVRNGFSQFGVQQLGFAANGSINSAGKIEGTSDIIHHYSIQQAISAHTSQSGTYVYSTYQPSDFTAVSAVRLKIESNGSITSKGLGLVGHISGY
ncbi:hypothetical protein CIK05_05945 [Bdellovibrio sp. qaytius]|nr:hypothetical protein CIK05_05945 [Bdellovibrio sp. qaytius]